MKRSTMALLGACLCALPTAAQNAPAPARTGDPDSYVATGEHDGAVDFGLVADGGKGVGERAAWKFFNAGVRLGKVVTPQIGDGFLRGNFEYAGEFLPLYQIYQPVYTARGVSLTPVILRWNFTRGRRFAPWAQIAGGFVYTTRNVPPGNTNRWNFMPQGGVGLHYFLKPHRSIDLGVNAIHLSNASLGRHNPGINASVHVQIGYTWWH